MDISLTGDYEKFLQEQMATGLYKSANEIVHEAMNLLKLKKNISHERLELFNAALQVGEDDIIKGRYSDGDVFFKELIKEYE